MCSGSCGRMISSTAVKVSSTWDVNGQFKISSTVHLQMLEESDGQIQSEYKPPLSVVNLFPYDESEAEKTTPCSLLLEAITNIRISSLTVWSSARHVEVYGDKEEYISTVRGELREDAQNIYSPGDEEQGKLYKKTIEFKEVTCRCRLKFLSLYHKTCFKLYCIHLQVKQHDLSSQMISRARQIDMSKVRSMLSSMPNQIPANVQNLMSTVEQYQQNQSSVLNDLQQQVLSSAPSEPVGAKLPSILGLLAKSGCTQPDRSGASKPSPDISVLSKVMSQYGHGLDQGEVASDPLSTGEDMFGMLRNICQSVSQMRGAERIGMKDCKQEKGAMESSKEMQRPEKCSRQQSDVAALEQRLLQQLQITEERMMGRLEKRLEEMENRVELRLNQIETLLKCISRTNLRKDAGSENNVSGNVTGVK